MKSIILLSLILIFFGGLTTVYAQESIPFWIQNTAYWWTNDKTSDSEFLLGINWLIFKGSLNSDYSNSERIPLWYKMAVEFWSKKLISDQEFLNLTQYVLNRGSLQLTDNISPDDFREHHSTNENELFKIYAYEKDFFIDDGQAHAKDLQFDFQSQIYDDILYDTEKQNSVVIVPLFTSSAYWQPGFYNYFRGECPDACLTTNIEYTKHLGYSASANAVKILSLLGYPLIYDTDVDKNPEILNQFEHVILLHNEYVTQTQFDAITNHPNVLYLFPNALYGKISVDYDTDTISLIRGHNYPEEEILNGFDWPHDNTHPYEYDSQCANWNFYNIPNGIMLNCYPENLIFEDLDFLKEIKRISLD